MADVSRNSPCPCGSGKKYKMCCGAAVVAAERAAEAEKSRFWTPDGVTTANDDTPGAFSGSIKWLMTYEPPKDGTPANDAESARVRPHWWSRSGGVVMAMSQKGNKRRSCSPR